MCAKENNADDLHTIISYNKILHTCRAIFIVRFSFVRYRHGRYDMDIVIAAYDKYDHKICTKTLFVFKIKKVRSFGFMCV